MDAFRRDNCLETFYSCDKMFKLRAIFYNAILKVFLHFVDFVLVFFFFNTKYRLTFPLFASKKLSSDE